MIDNEKGINVLSLFDGISCGQLALERAGIKVDKYYASEIDNYATIISEKNYPDIIRLGDVTKWKEWDIDWSSIDIVAGGSPCQSFSITGNGKGFEGKSGLFYEYIDILNHIKQYNPNIKFLLENVVMKKEWEYEISKSLGISPILIDSTLVSAQKRKRLYWTNIPFQKHINNQHLNIKDIIEKEVDNKYYFNNIGLDDYINKISHNMNTKPSKDGVIKLFDIPKDIIKDNERQRRVFSIEGKSPTILARADTTKIFINNKIRKLTPLECERLQCIPDNYTYGVSNTKRYKMIGNGWTVEVIAHIFSFLNKNIL